jgi:hypothetical protein
LLPGQTYAYAISAPYSAGNRTAFDQHASNVYILGLTGGSRNLLYNRPGSPASDHGAAANLAVSNLGMMVALASLVVVSGLWL